MNEEFTFGQAAVSSTITAGLALYAYKKNLVSKPVAIGFAVGMFGLAYVAAGTSSVKTSAHTALTVLQFAPLFFFLL